MEEFGYEEIKAATKGFSLDMLVGKGSHGHVYRAVLTGNRLVAVKKPSAAAGHESDAGSKLGNEISILSSIRSPHFVNLLGVVVAGRRGGNDDEAGRRNMMIMEFMPNGSLYDLLHSSAPKLQPPPTWARRVALALQVARGLQALHEAATPAIVHRDVKSSNILLDSRWNAKLADFSLAVRRHTGRLCPAPPAPAGTIGYLDPCYTGPGKLGAENDVFSYGVVLLELVSGRRVMDPACDTTSIVAWASPLIRDGIDVAVLCDSRMVERGCTEGMNLRSISQVLRLAARCISLDREKRPSAAEIVGELRTVVDRLRQPVLSRMMKAATADGIRGYAKAAWRMRRKARVAAATRIVVCRDHLLDGDEEGNGEDSNVLPHNDCRHLPDSAPP